VIRISVALNPQRVIPVLLRFMFLSTQAQEQQHTSKSNLTFLSRTSYERICVKFESIQHNIGFTYFQIARTHSKYVMRYYFVDFSIWLLVYRIVFSCLYSRITRALHHKYCVVM